MTTEVSRLTYGITRLSIKEQSERAYVADVKGYFPPDQEMESVML